MTFTIIFLLLQRYVHFQPERNWKGYEMMAGIAWNNPNIGSKELEDFSRVSMFIWTRGGRKHSRSYASVELSLGFT